MNAATFREPLTGQILVDQGVSQEVISMSGNGSGRQNVLVRADLLINPRRLESTSLQLEYLPSGLICSGTVAHVQPTGFSGTCRVSDGTQREITAHWHLVSGNSLQGEIDSRPVA